MQTLSSLFPQSSTLVIAFSRLWIPDPSRRPSISSRFSSSVERGLPSRSVHVAAPIVQMGPSLPSHHDSHPFLSSRPIHHRPVSLAFSLNTALLLSHASFGTAPAASMPLVLCGSVQSALPALVSLASSPANAIGGIRLDSVPITFFFFLFHCLPLRLL